MTIRLAMVAPRRERCGVSEATRGLVEALRRHVELVYDVPAEQFSVVMNDVDLIHVQHQYFLFGGVAPWKCSFLRLARKFRRPVVLTAHEVVLPSGSTARRLATRVSNRLHFGHRSIRSILVHTDLDAVRIRQAGGARAPVRVVRLGVPALKGLPDRAEARRALGLEGRFVGLLPGFLSRRKGHEAALDAYRLLPPRHLLVLAGGRHPDDHSGYPDRIARLAADHPNARLTGYLEPEMLQAYLAAADFMAAPFVESSGSASLALAFAAGLPVIASDIPPHREIESLVESALHVVSGGEPEHLAAAIVRLEEDSDFRDALGRGAAAYASTFSYERQAVDTLAVYREVLEA